MNTIVIMIGLQASGKSTFCQEYLKKYYCISLDQLHTRRKELLEINSCIEQHRNFVIDNTNPSVQDRKRYFDIVSGTDYHIVGYYMRSVIKECIPRNEQRTGKAKIPRTAIAATSKKIELPSYSEGFHELYYVEMTQNGFKINNWEE